MQWSVIGSVTQDADGALPRLYHGVILRIVTVYNKEHGP